MNRTINIICGLILLVMTAYAVATVWIMVDGVSEAMDKNGESGPYTYEFRQETASMSLQIKPEAVTSPADSLTLADGSRAAFIPQKGYIIYPKEKARTSPIGMTIAASVLLAANVVLLIMAVAAFLKFIVAIERKRIFERANARLLKRFGVYTILSAVALIGAGIIQELEVLSLPVPLRDYDVESIWAVPWGVVLVGLGGLLLSQIWLKAIQMKEDQELTV